MNSIFSNKSRKPLIAAAAFLLGIVPGAFAKPLKVFILAGQSNMQSHANIAIFDYIGDDPVTAPLLKKMRGADGKPQVAIEMINAMRLMSDCGACFESITLQGKETGPVSRRIPSHEIYCRGSWDEGGFCGVRIDWLRMRGH